MTRYSEEPPRRNLLVHHTFDRVDIDRVIDTSPQAIDGNVVGGVTFGHTGAIGTSARFANQNDDVEINALSEFFPLSAMTVTSWGRSQRAIGDNALNVYATVVINGEEKVLSHVTDKPATEWQFAALRYDGSTVRLHYGTTADGAYEQVDSVDAVGAVEDFELTFYTDGYGYVDDTRVYRTDLDDEQTKSLFQIGNELTAVDQVGDAWPTEGIPFRGTNQQFGGALAEEKAYVLRQLDAVLQARHIETAGGEQLDRIGKLAGIRRKEGESDEKYRRRMVSTLSAARSSGTFEDLLSVAADVVGTDESNIEIESAPPTATVYIPTAIIEASELTIPEITDLLDDAAYGAHTVEVVEQGENPFTVINDAMVTDEERGLTSDSISTGGGLVSDV